MIKRELNLPVDQNLFLFGPRQTGKSTLLKSIFLDQKVIYYDLLDAPTMRRFVTKPELMLLEVEFLIESKQITHVIIDEIQKIPELLDEVHKAIAMEMGCKFLLSGSSARKLKRSHANMLGGRAWTFNLYPFTFEEMGAGRELHEILRFGNLPPVCLAKDDYSRQEILRSYCNTYIKEEIEVEVQVRKLGAFLRFLTIVASENGELINYSNISREVGLKSHLVKAYYQILEDTLLGFFLLPFNKSVRKKMSKHPKFYLFDMGVVSALTNKLTISFKNPAENRMEYGRAFEHFLLTEIYKINDYHRKDWVLSFYRTEKGVEVDCLIETPSGQYIAIEFKSHHLPERIHAKGLRSLKEVLPDAKLLLASTSKLDYQIGDVTVMPWESLLRFLKKV